MSGARDEETERVDAVDGEASWSPPESMRTFLCSRVRSPESLEILGLMAAPPVRWWSAKELAQKLCLSERGVEDALQALFESGLLLRTQDRCQFGYRPASGYHHDLVKRSLAAYRDYPGQVARLLTSGAMTRVRSTLQWLLERLATDQTAKNRWP